MNLKPSEIFYSQNNIAATFGERRHRGEYIGETLDDLLDGRLSVKSFPTIKVTQKPGCKKWYTLDNRRLWMFRHLEGAGKCIEVPVCPTSYSQSYESKFTTINGGTNIYVRSDPRGRRWRRIRPAQPVYIPNPPVPKPTVTVNPTDIIRRKLIERLEKIKRGCPLPVVPYQERKGKDLVRDYLRGVRRMSRNLQACHCLNAAQHRFKGRLQRSSFTKYSYLHARKLTLYVNITKQCEVVLETSRFKEFEIESCGHDAEKYLKELYDNETDKCETENKEVSFGKDNALIEWFKGRW